MNDTPLDLDALASAFLDDEATVDERAQVSADPQLRRALDERLEQMRAVRALLGDVEPASISTRETHLAEALAAWDRIPEAERTGARRDLTPRDIDGAAAAAAASVTSSSRRRDRGRPTSTRWLTVAAAAVGVLAVGGIVLRFTGDNAMDDAGSAEESAENFSTEDVSTEAGDVAADAAGETELRAELSDQDDASGSAEQADAPDTAAADGSAGTLATGVDVAAPPPEDALVLLTNAQDLVDFASAALQAPAASDAPAATSAPVDDDELGPAPTFPDCDALDLVVGPAMYRDVAVLVGIDASRDRAIAVRIDDCITVATARL